MLCSRRQSGRPALPVCLVGLLFGLQAATCEPSQQQQQQHQRAGANELSQDSFGVMAAPEALAALGSYGRGLSYVNSKRARKMSAFMPMRGRKDGHDALRLQPHQQQQRQLDGLHLGLASLAAQGGGLEPWASLGEPSAVRSMERPAVPRHFMERLAQMMRARALLAGSGRVQASPTGQVEIKYRRAFHPMRGKRAEPHEGTDADTDVDVDADADQDGSESEPVGFIPELAGEPFESAP